MGDRTPRLQRLLGASSWKYAAGELAIIVLGVIIGLAVSNWNEHRKDEHDEISMLRQIRTQLSADTTDMKANVDLMRESRNSALTIRHQLENHLPMADSLRVHYDRIGVIILHKTNSAAYETLKSRGLDLITNDSLRVAIADYYAGDYGIISRYDALNAAFFDRWWPVLNSRVRQDDMASPAIPHDVAALGNDTVFLGLLDELIQRLSWMGPYEQLYQDRARSLIQGIEREITRR